MKNILFRKASVFNQVFFGVLFVPALLAGFLLAQPVLASAYSKTITQSSGPACEYVYRAYGEQAFGQSFFSTSTNITAIALKIARMDANSSISEIKICQGDFSTPNTYSSAIPDWNCDQLGQKPIVTFKPDSSIIPISYSPNWVDFDLPFPISPELNKRYFILFKMSNSNICIQNYRDYPYGQSRTEGTNAKDLPFNVYYTTDTIDWSAAIPDKTNDLRQDDYYSSGYSVNLAWTTPSPYQLSGATTHKIEYWPKLYNCQTDYGFGGIPNIKKQTGEYIVGPGQKSETIVKDLNKNTSYCFALTSSNQYQQSEISNFAEAKTNNNSYTEDLALNADFCGYSYQASLYGQSFVTDQSNISSISLKMKNVYATPGQAYEIQLCQGEMTAPQWNQPGQDWDCKQPGQILLATTTTNQAIAFGTPDWLNFHFASSINISPNQKLFFIFQGQGVSVCGERDYDKYLLGEARSSNNARDFAFRTFYDTGLQEKKRNPVIIVPGIIASYLNNSNDNEVWLNLGQNTLNCIKSCSNNFCKLNCLAVCKENAMICSQDDSFLNDLILERDGGQGGNKFFEPSDIFRKVEDLDFFAGLIQELKNNGYKEDVDLFVFPYDWRLNLNWTAGDSPLSWQETLKQKIEKVKLETGSQKVDIIAHSMGGIVVKNYIQKYSIDADSNINKFIDIATPHLGSPKAFKILNYGDNLDMCVGSFCFLNEGKVKDISQNMPSIYQLLPSREYFNQPYSWANGGYIKKIEYSFPIGFHDRFLSYDESIVYLRDKKRNDFLLGLSKDDSASVNVNDELHSRLDGLPAKDNYYNIMGCGVGTYAGEKISGIHGPLDPIHGDGTVPLQSADKFGLNSNKYYVATSTHAFLPSFNGVKQLIVSILNGENDAFDYSPYKYLSQDMSVCPEINGVQVGSHSPVELHIYDEYGNHVGPLDNGDMEEGIPGVMYDVVGEDKYAWLPAGRKYRIVNDATSAGKLGITIRKVQNGQGVELSYFDSIPLFSSSTLVSYDVIDNQSNYQVELDSNGDGVVENNVLPSSILSGDQINDSLAPTTTITISGQEGDSGYYVSPVTVKFVANDETVGSGVLETKYSLDGGETWINYIGEFVLSNDDQYSLMYQSVDKAGNKEVLKESAIKIDMTDPDITMLVPQDGQEIGHNSRLKVEYLAEDASSGLRVDTSLVYFDGKIIELGEVDLFKELIGQHLVKVVVTDNAGNLVEKEVAIRVITTISGTIADISRAYSEGYLNQRAKESLISDFKSIQDYLDKNAVREERRQEVKSEIMDKCIARKGQSWCDEKLGDIFDKVDYHLTLIQEKLVLVKYGLVLKKLELYQKIGWMTKAGGGIIKEDVEYLISKIK